MADNLGSVSETGKKNIHILEIWKNQPVKCIHCGKELKNYAAKNSHLQHCKKRILTRFLKVEGFLFVIRWNPLKRRAMALQKTLDEYKDKKPENLPILILGACTFLKNSGTLHNFAVIEIENSPQLKVYTNGWIGYPIIKKYMATQDMTVFESNVVDLQKQIFNNNQSVNTESIKVE